MKYYLMIAFMALSLSVNLTACNPDEHIEEIEQPIAPDEPDDNNGNINNPMSNNLKISIGSASFTVTLVDNETSQAFKASLPMTVTMNEMNGNEKFYYLSNNLPTNPYQPGTIQEGDLLLYGSNCLVLFYETFSSAYSYTRIGRIDNPSGLSAVLGAGNVSITFEIRDKD
ncbi:cyclophilin-like fold protein [Parabacteroides bouchesdurhonensis]|uniref:cyclophilin-like fold protein n=1 Tax=Parabacteroides bouchesdurhonensis TaxID=1936995 RepID=UPI000C850C13|nr:cyclophilin-like fold protein [Parabacteroides bouchesdurhonensis]